MTSVLTEKGETMRPIDADALTVLLHDDIDGLDEEFPNDKQVKPYMCGVRMALSFIDTAPTIDTAPVRHGHWDVREPMPMNDIKGNLSWGNWYVCTGCGFETTAIEGHITQYKYCPSCGARMDGENDEIDRR